MRTEASQAAKYWRSGVLALLLAAGALTGPTFGAELPSAVDLRREAEQATRQGGPLIVLFSRHDCKYCETVKRDYLKPLGTAPHHRERVLVRQINQDSATALTDFQGNPTTQSLFAGREKLKLFPVVAFYGRDGRHLAPPIVGARLPDFYQSYLDDAIAQSVAALRSR